MKAVIGVGAAAPASAALALAAVASGVRDPVVQVGVAALAAPVRAAADLAGLGRAVGGSEEVLALGVAVALAAAVVVFVAADPAAVLGLRAKGRV